ncbi:MAG: formate dehydrogenase, partial [Gemmatimonadales bacterium]|nr:formate dehydrogenase [Gemmatimonadales bacterium]
MQGATDNPVLYHILPGYLAMPTASQRTWDDYLRAITPAEIQPADGGPRALNYWKNAPAFAASLLKAWWGDAARPDNGFAYDYLPKLESDPVNEGIEDRYDHISIFHKMDRGIVKGLWLMGQNPAVGGPNAAFERKAMRNLDFLVVHDFHESESASIWQQVSDPGVDPEQVKTEVFLIPAAGPFERDGSKTHTGRWIQWFHRAVRPYGESKDEIEVATHIHFKVKELYEREGGAFPDPVVELRWNFHPAGPVIPPAGPFEHPSAEAVAREINGYALADIRLADGTLVRKGEQLPGFHALRADGTTACGNWIYSGYYTEEGNISARRDPDDPTGIGLHPGWAFCWPANRRILYNRASVDLEGRPWDPKRPVIWWTGSEWAGDVPDGGGPPGTVAPFIMKPEGVGRLFGPDRVDGPFPEHYEPFESPVPNLLSSVQTNPVVWRWDNVDPEATPLALFNSPDSERFPHICSTWRLTEYLTSMSRNVSWLAQLQPQMFVEISRELAAELGIESGEIVAVDSKRGRVVCRALVTPRVWPLEVNG